MSKPNIPLYSALLFILFGLILSGITYHLPIGDYVNYYFGSLLLKNGLFTQDVYEPYRFNLIIRELNNGQFFANYTPVPPVTSLLLIPFTYLTVGASKLVFNLFSVLLFSIAFYRLVRHLQISTKWLLLLPIIMLPVLKSNVAQGQLYLIVTALLIEGWLQHKNGHLKTASLLWGGAIALKIFPAIILLYLILKKDYRTTAFMVAAVIIISILPMAFMPGHIILNYYSEILPRLMVGEINDPYATVYQSFTVLCRKTFVSDKLLNPENTYHNPILKSLFSLIYTSLLLAFTVIINKKEYDNFIKFSIIVFIGVLISGYGTFYGLILLIPLLVALIKNGNTTFVIAAIVLCVALVLPVKYFHNLPLLAQFPRLYLFITATLFISYRYKLHYYASAGMTILFVPLLVLSNINLPTHIRNNYYLTIQPNLLLYDYAYTPGQLHLKYITDAGIKEGIKLTTDSMCRDSALKVINGNIYAGELQITNSGCRKLKPMRINSKQIIYLSDEDRGVGFYTLRLAAYPNSKI